MAFSQKRPSNIIVTFIGEIFNFQFSILIEFQNLKFQGLKIDLKFEI